MFLTNFIETPPAARFRLCSSGFIPFCNLAIGLKVGVSLFLVCTALAALHINTDAKEASGQNRR